MSKISGYQPPRDSLPRSAWSASRDWRAHHAPIVAAGTRTNIRVRCLRHVSLQRSDNLTPRFPPPGPRRCKFPGFLGTIRALIFLPSVSPRFVAFAWRYRSRRSTNPIRAADGSSNASSDLPRSSPGRSATRPCCGGPRGQRRGSETAAKRRVRATRRRAGREADIVAGRQGQAKHHFPLGRVAVLDIMPPGGNQLPVMPTRMLTNLPVLVG